MIVFLLLLLPFTAAAEEGDFIFFNDPLQNHTLGTLNTVLQMIRYYEKGFCEGVEVDFQKKGVYFVPGQGPNWWSYYFEPVCLGNSYESLMIPSDANRGREIGPAIQNSSAKKFHKIFKKYIRFKPVIKQKAQAFFNQHFEGHTLIGIHYGAFPRIDYTILIAEVHKYLKANKVHDYRIFVSTEKEKFLEAIQIAFPGRVHSISMKRFNGSPPTHFSSPFIRGQNELLDWLLLTKSDFLIHTPSLSAKLISYYDPDIPHIEVNGRSRPPY
jgi:hypothetical protein